MRTAAVCLVVVRRRLQRRFALLTRRPDQSDGAHDIGLHALRNSAGQPAERTRAPGATVRLDTGQSTAAGADGRYRFQNVSGAVTVTASGPHHVAASETATMDQDRSVDFALAHTGVPPFEGTVFISPRLIDSSDSSSLMNVTYAGRGMREVFDRRVDRWITVDAYLFNVRYGWGAVEFQVNPEFGSVDAARAEVDTYAPALGRLPAFLMTNAREVEINAGVELFGGNPNGSFLIHTGQGRRYIDDGFLEEILFHEAAHVSLDTRHANAPGWTTAQNADGVFVSTYARDNPGREDVVESILPYFAVQRRSARLGDTERIAILAAIPNRLDITIGTGTASTGVPVRPADAGEMPPSTGNNFTLQN